MEFQILFLLAFALIISTWTSIYGKESPAEIYWKTNVGNDITMPKVFKDALLGSQGNKKDNNAVKTRQNFDKNVARVYAQQLVREGSGDKIRYNAVQAYAQLPTDNSVIFFFEKDLVHPGSRMKLHFLMGAQEAKFMPTQLANSITFSSTKLPQILKFFDVNPKSENAKIIEETITMCESKPIKGESKSCETSLESMVNYVKSRLGKQVKALSTEINEETKQDYTIESAQKINNEKNLVCHKMVYPYAVFYCHTLSKTDAYQVSLIDTHGKKIRAVAVCHKDTSPWSEGHIAFQLLKVKPGGAPICHFLDVDTVIWAPK
ncbi:hypothetical protein RND81_08G163800 [Saponaria officinalis]|uniref:BURP domain-containing protein n=1 Tax=Saponaria officinalis TaxID=3572 RepID=A0AAW1J856_SAPOF